MNQAQNSNHPVPVTGLDGPGSGSLLPAWWRFVEPTTPLLLAADGTLLLARVDSRPAEWFFIAVTVSLGVAGYWGWGGRTATVARAWLLVAITWVLLLLAGGVGSFFTLWYFVLAPVYASLLGGRASVLYPVVIGVAYLSLAPSSDAQIPEAVLWGRTAAMVGSGLIVAAVSLARTRAAALALELDRGRRHAELLQGAVVESAGDPIIGLEAGLTITLFNRRAEEVFGYSREDALGMHIDRLIAEPDRARLAAHLGPGGDHLTAITVGGLHRDGSEFPFEGTFGRVASEGLDMTIVVVRDVSSQMMAQDRLRDLVEAKDEFIASVSHEVRTPLTSVVGFAALLNEPDSAFEEPERGEITRVILDQALEVSNLVEDLLVASRGDIGELSMATEMVDLRREVDVVVAGTVPANVAEGPSVIVTGSEALARADGVRVRQILRNLLSNALNYGGSEITVEIGSGDGVATVEVADDGAGLGSEDEAVLFEPYRRFHERPGRPESVGLGLTVSLRLAGAMGGDLTYERRDGWTVFRLEIPRWA